MNVETFLKNEKVVLLESMGEYSRVYTKNSIRVVSYTRANLTRRGLINLKQVRRGIYVSELDSKIENDNVEVLGKKFKISRRMKSIWVFIFFLISNFVFAQNQAPVAVNDTIKTCIDEPFTYFSVTTNDFDPNGDKIRLNSFTSPAAGELVSASNTGFFRYTWNIDFLEVLFNYTIRDLRFANIGSLVSNVATVRLEGSEKYLYSGSYTSTNTRLTCISKNIDDVIISGTARESNTAYQYILLDANEGTVEISPSAGGMVEFKIKK